MKLCTGHVTRHLICLALVTLATSFVLATRISLIKSHAQSNSIENTRAELFRGKKAVTRQVLVRFRKPIDRAQIAQVEQELDIEIDREVGGTGVRLMQSVGRSVETLVSELSRRVDVIYAEPNYIGHLDSIPNDPQFSDQWGLRNTGQTVQGVVGNPGADIKAVPAWNISTGSREFVVGIVDSGIDYNHPDLAPNVWAAPTAFTVQIGGQSITCNAGSHGFNSISKNCVPFDDNINVNGDIGHGTHISGIIGAVGNNGVGVAGINWTSNLMGLKAADADGNISASNAMDAIEFAIQTKQIFGSNADVRVLNNSYGIAFSQSLRDEIVRANDNDLLFVASAGNGTNNDGIGKSNDTSPQYPASYDVPNVVAVAATDNQGGLPSFSNYGRNSVHLGAPGKDILSTSIINGYQFLTGTSQAAPQVSGAAALVLSRWSFDTASLKRVLLNSVDVIPSLSGKTISGGRLNVYRALTEAASAGANAGTMPSGWYWPTGAGFDHVSFCNYLGWLGYNSPAYPWHLAQDMCNGNSSGNPVYSIGEGDIILSRSDVSGYGPGYTNGGALVARYQAADGMWFTVLYGHLNDPHAVGHVSAGEILGYSNAWNPPHVHFAIHPGFDPEPNNPWRGYTANRSTTYGFTDPIPFLNAHPRNASGGQTFDGHHDGTTCDKIFGWAWDRTQPTARVNVDIYDGSTKLGTVTASGFRQDLLNAGIGDGFHAFNFSTPSSLKDGLSHTITIKFANTTFQLSNTGQQFVSTCNSTPTAAFTMSACGKSAINNQTLPCLVSLGAKLSVDLDSSSSLSGGSTIDARQWKIDGAVVSTLPRFTYPNLGSGTHTVTLDVVNSAGIHDNTSGTIVVTETSAAAPIVDFITPTSVAPSIFDLTINGSNFDANSIDQIYFGNSFVGNGQIISRTGSTQIKVRESMSSATLGTYTVRVKNSDGQLSNGLPLTLNQTQNPAPAIVSINPSSVTPSVFDLTINGTNFDNGAIEQLFFGTSLVGSGTILSRTATQIRARESMTTATLGTYTVKVRNSDGQLSNGVGLALTQGQTLPTISNMTTSPNPPIGGQPFNFTITGNNYDTSNAEVFFLGPGCSTTSACVVSGLTRTATQLTGAAVLASGAFTAQVRNGSTGTPSNTWSFNVSSGAPTPTITNIATSPNPPVGGQTFTFTITGTNYNTSNAEVFFLGPGCSTSTSCVVSGLTRTATQLGGAAVLAAGSFTAQVRNGSAGTPSNTWPLTVNTGPTTPSISNLSPTSVGAGVFSETINGSNFDPATVEVVINGPSCSPCTVPNSALTTKTSSQVVAPVTLGNTGSFTFQVRNGSSGTLSNSQTLTVNSVVINNISPTSRGTGSFNLTINGSGFNPESVLVVINGPSCSPCTVSNGVLSTKTTTQVVAPVTLNNGGDFSIQVRNGAAGPLSSSATLTITATPSISSISPTSVGAGVFSETINGSNFDPATVEVVINGPSCSPCTVPNSALTTKTSSQVVAPVTLGNTGSFTFQVRNGSSGTLSNSQTLTVNSVVINNISPTSRATGSFNLTINGSGFNPESVLVVINGPSCSPCTVSNGVLSTKTTTQVVAPVTLNNAGDFTIQVRNGNAGPLSSSATLTITAIPSISSISPTSVGAGVFSETINGSNFDPATVEVVINGPSCSPCTVPNSALTTKTSSQVVAPVTLGNTGSFTFQVRNGSSGTLSNSQTLTVNSVVINNISPTSRATGSFNLTINGSGFNPESVLVVINGPSCSPCTVSNGVLSTKTTTQVVAPVTLNNAGDFTIQVRNGNAGPLSSSATLTITAIPSISSISPTSVGAGVFSETINGSNFDPATVEVVINGPSCSPCTVPNSALTTKTSSQVVAPVTLGNTGSFTFQVRNGSSGTLSNSKTLTVNSVVINNISPTSRATGSFNLTINGSGFTPASVLVVINGPSCSPCTVSNSVLSTKTTAQVVAPLTLNNTGTFTIQVKNGSAGPLSNGQTLVIQ